MKYEVGDYVVPSDLPRRWVCRVAEVERKALAGGETLQILTLEPLAGPWRPGTLLVRLDGSVRPVDGRNRTRNAVRRAADAARRTHDGPGAVCRGKVIRFPISPRRLRAPLSVVEDGHE